MDRRFVKKVANTRLNTSFQPPPGKSLETDVIATMIRKLVFRLRGLWLQPPRSESNPAERPAKEYNEQDEVSYETRVVAFIDILGWRKAVEEFSVP